MKKGSLLNKFMSFSVGSWLGIFVGFFTTPIITRILSPEDFGKASMFTLAINVLLIISLLGTDQSFTRFFYEEEVNARKKLLGKCLGISIKTFLVIALIIMFFSDNLSIFLFGEVNAWMMILLFFCVFVQIINRFAILIIRMEQRGFIFSLLQLLTKIFDFIGILIFAYLIGDKYEIMIYSQVFSSVLIAGLAIYFSFHFWKLNDNKCVASISTKDIVKFGFPLVFTMLITWLFQSIDRIAIKEWATYSELGLYAAAFKIVALLNILQTTFTTFWVPVSYERFKNNPEDKDFFSKMIGYISLGMFMVALGTIVFKDLIIYLLGQNYSEAADIMPFLVFMPLMYTISETTVVGINFYKKTKWHLWIASITCVISLIGNWYLVPLYGAKGAALSTGIAYIMFFLLRSIVAKRYFKIRYSIIKLVFCIFLLTIYSLYVSFWQPTFRLNLLIGLVIALFYFFLFQNVIRDIVGKLVKEGE